MSTPPRFAIDTVPAPGATVRIGGDEAHHMRDVARIRAGELVTLLGPDGSRFTGPVERYDRTGAEVRIETVEPPVARPTLIVAAAVIKGPRMDFIVEKTAELGATELRPIVCARGLVRTPGIERLARWRRLAMAASKQSLVAPAMQVTEPVSFSDLIRNVPGETLAIICYAAAPPIGAVIAERAPRGVLIATGPEGDFDSAELDDARAAGFVGAGLGPNRLRSETAAIAASAIAGEWLARSASQD